MDLVGLLHQCGLDRKFFSDLATTTLTTTSLPHLAFHPSFFRVGDLIPNMALLEASLSIPQLLVSFACILLTYLITTAGYRLYFSPLAKFPGPKLAALTLWYEFYYDVVKRGRFTWKIAELHNQYGEHQNLCKLSSHFGI